MPGSFSELLLINHATSEIAREVAIISTLRTLTVSFLQLLLSGSSTSFSGNRPLKRAFCHRGCERSSIPDSHIRLRLNWSQIWLCFDQV